MAKRKTSYTKSQFKKEFARLMATTSWPNNLPQEESTKVLRELDDLVLPHIPAKLFRFRKCGIDEVISFEQGTISMCVADKFSDKYDSNVYYNYHTLTERFEKSFFPIIRVNMPFVIRQVISHREDSSMFSRIRSCHARMR